MPRQLFANNATSSLSVAVSSSTQAAITIQTGHGSRFPSPYAPGYALITLDDGTNVEVCKLISRSGDVLTVLRGYENTTAQSSFAATITRVELRLTESGIDFISDLFPLDVSGQVPVIGVASVHVIRCSLLSEAGSATGQVITTSSYRDGQIRRRIASANSAKSIGHSRLAQPWLVPPNGGRFVARFGFAAAPSSSHFFIGLVGTTGIYASETPPSSVTNAIVCGYVGSGLGTNLSVWHAASGRTSVAWDLGSYFTVQTNAWYELRIDANKISGTWITTVRRLDISSIADVSTAFTTDVPDSRGLYSPQIHAVTLCASMIAVEWGGWSLKA